jgi:hypothetical protein
VGLQVRSFAAARRGSTRLPSRPLAWLVLVALAIALGVGIAMSPLTAVVVVAVVCLVTYQVSVGDRANRTFLVALAALLIAYAALDRGVAYVGFGGLYLGEFVLALALLPTIRMIFRVGLGPIEALVLLFMIWGAARTIPYIGQYGLLAIRDGAVWGYGIFALAVSVAMTRGAAVRVANGYRRLLPWFLIWVPIAYGLASFASQYLPSWPGAPVPIVYVKTNDLAVHLTVASAFLLVGLYDRRPTFVPAWAIWGLWLLDSAVVSSVSRGGLMAILIGTAAMLLFRIDARRLVQGAAIALSFFVIMVLVNPSFETGYSGRTVSFNQLVNNLLSVVGVGDVEDAGQLEGNREWRLSWWREIIHYTTGGPLVVTGKGFGINLADEDGFQIPDGSLRSPHSAHFTILARGGLTMVILWVLLNVVFAFMVFTAARRAKATGRPLLTQLLACSFALWLAAIVGMSFDVYLEGPQGGIWFWAAIGFGAWLVRAERTGTDLDAPVSPAPEPQPTMTVVPSRQRLAPRTGSPVV